MSKDSQPLNFTLLLIKLQLITLEKELLMDLLNSLKKKEQLLGKRLLPKPKKIYD